MPFHTKTGRNQPQGRDRIFLPALPAWLQGIIAPPIGEAAAELDWTAQEIAIMAGMSGDPAMITDYATGDPHLHFGKRAGLIPEGGTKETHRELRDSCKPVVLGTNYGMTAYGIAAKTGKSLIWARDIHARHRRAYSVFHEWLGDTVVQARFDCVIRSPFGWPQAVIGGTTARSLMNFPAQSGGADMMRIAAIAATEAGISVACPIHDAFWITAPLDGIDATIEHMTDIMRRAGRAVAGIPVGVETEAVVRWPDCLGDVRKPSEKGQATWLEINRLISDVDLMRQAG
jgi:DNA polymerase I-like protein with 3'-5' exonuclease and polymerase domains